MNLSSDPKVIGLANSLELHGGDPVENIRTFCQERVKAFLRSVKGTLTMDRLEKVVCKRLKLRVHRVWSNFELERLSAEYVRKGEIVFAALEQQLSPDAFGVFIRLMSPDEAGNKWVTVIDCRGDKHLRQHWTLWHEISHCLTAVDQMHLPLRRTMDSKRDPIEAITDVIASDFAFYAPIFQPVLDEVVAKHGGILTFAAVAEVNARFCPEASFHSTLNACVSLMSGPYMVVEASLRLKKSEESKVAAGNTGIKPALRVTHAIPNKAGQRQGLFIPSNYRVPTESVIATAHRAPRQFSSNGRRRVENLGSWTDSRGGKLADRVIHVEVKKTGDSVLALIRAEV